MHLLCCEPQTSVPVQKPSLSFSYQDALADTLSQVLLRLRHCASLLPFPQSQELANCLTA